jgi:hypothetical protein
MVMGITGQDGP